MSKLLVSLSFLLVTTACSPVAMQLDNGPFVVNATQAEYHWPRGVFPIQVFIHPQLDPAIKAGMLLAISAWNELVGTEVFTPSEAPATWPMFAENGATLVGGFISVEQGIAGSDPETGVNRNAYAMVHLKSGNAALFGEIHSSRIVMGVHLTVKHTLSKIARIAFHELGHSLGLDHDVNDETSIMFPSATLPIDQDLQDADLAYIREQVGVWTEVEILHDPRTQL